MGQSFIQHKQAVERFIKENNKEPTAIDFDEIDYLPVSRTIQRRYGGLPQFRDKLNLKVKDFTKGQPRKETAKKALQINEKIENELFEQLVDKHGHQNVSSPVHIFAYSAKTLDFKIYFKNKIYLIDVFTPKDLRSCKACVRIKNKKYLTNETQRFTEPTTILFVCTNPNVDVTKVKSPTPVWSLDQFKKYFL